TGDGLGVHRRRARLGRPVPGHGALTSAPDDADTDAASSRPRGAGRRDVTAPPGECLAWSFVQHLGDGGELRSAVAAQMPALGIEARPRPMEFSGASLPGALPGLTIPKARPRNR